MNDRMTYINTWALGVLLSIVPPLGILAGFETLTFAVLTVGWFYVAARLACELTGFDRVVGRKDWCNLVRRTKEVTPYDIDLVEVMLEKDEAAVLGAIAHWIVFHKELSRYEASCTTHGLPTINYKEERAEFPKIHFSLLFEVTKVEREGDEDEDESDTEYNLSYDGGSERDADLPDEADDGRPVEPLVK